MAQKDLIPFSQRTEEDQKKIRQKGGQASGRKRRQIRDLKEAIKASMGLEIQMKNGEKMTGAEGIAKAVLTKALKGEVKSVQQILDLLYGRKQEVDLKGNVVTKLPDLHIEFLSESASQAGE